ncbi:glucosidase 2 subunit alpha [Trichomonascus vanleenenianus]|uniref:glucan 1,3-alpha-glucosidase ROT2 n=1 Tax=Trichomonascus vanleenenianus TaxID=2268995 RepID=UPI003ECA9D56
MNRLVLLVISLYVLIQPVLGVKPHLFRKCDQNPFCKRNRHYAEQVVGAASDWNSPYALKEPEIDESAGVIRGTVIKTVNNLEIELPLTLSVLESGGVRVSIDEKKRMDGDIEVFGDESVTKLRYNVTEHALIGPLKKAPFTFSQSKNHIKVSYGGSNEVELELNPLRITFSRGGEQQVVLNGKGLLNYEHYRPIEGDGVKDHVGPFELEEGLWEDEFDNFKDKKTRGPESIALDIGFSGYKHVYGIPEHADSMALRGTKGKNKGDHTDPYRLFNVDIFEYETSSPLPMYGSIPFMQAQKKGASAGVFWANAADTYIDIDKAKDATTTHWMSENGLLDVFVFLGDTPEEINRQYGAVTGNSMLPQTFAIGYHQCRWNYNSQEDVLEIDSNFDYYGMPYDVIWLDVEYTEQKKYFTWNQDLFPDHVAMMGALDKTKRKLVPIIDPHIKVADNYDVVKTLQNKLLAAKNSKGELFYGHCWPGESVWIDPFNPGARKYWAELFSKKHSFGGGADNMHIWNDMNEPSVFDGPETTFPKSNIHHGGWEHRDIHNIHGMLVVGATVDALNERYDHTQRPFVLTRSYFAGSQRHGAMWSGDNQATWEFLEESLPMLLTSNIAGMPYSGADIGGFFGDPTPELLTRWYQAGAFYPFFRAHAHIDSKRREPYVADAPYNTTARDAIRLRYRLLPTLYTAFYEASQNLSPVIKPTYYITPQNEKVYAIENQFFVGDGAILVKPVTKEGATSVDVYLPDNEIYYDYDTYAPISGEGSHKVSAPLEKIPMFMRGGHIHVRRDRFRRSAELMKNDPYTLVVAVSKDGTAKGKLYVDDGVSYEYQSGKYILVEFEFDGKILKSTVSGDSSAPFAQIPIERVIIVGKKLITKSATVTQGPKSWDAAVLDNKVVRNPRMIIGQNWSLTI